MLQRPRLPHVPPLSIAHFMAWTTVTAVIVALNGVGSSQQRIQSAPWTLSVILAIYSIVVGWIVWGSLLIVWHAVRRSLWQLEPGERVLLGLLAAVMANWIGKIWFAVAFSESSADPYRVESFQSLQRWLGIRQIVRGATVALSWVAIAVMARRQRRWAWAMGAAAPVIVFLQIELLFVNAWWVRAAWLGGVAIAAYVSLGLIVAAILGDRRHRAPRHWLHWSGVFLALLVLAAAALSISASFF